MKFVASSKNFNLLYQHSSFGELLIDKKISNFVGIVSTTATSTRKESNCVRKKTPPNHKTLNANNIPQKQSFSKANKVDWASKNNKLRAYRKWRNLQLIISFFQVHSDLSFIHCSQLFSFEPSICKFPSSLTHNCPAEVMMNGKELSFNYKSVWTLDEEEDELNIRHDSRKSASKSHGLISFNTLQSQKRLFEKLVRNNRQRFVKLTARITINLFCVWKCI